MFEGTLLEISVVYLKFGVNAAVYDSGMPTPLSPLPPLFGAPPRLYWRAYCIGNVSVAGQHVQQL